MTHMWFLSDMFREKSEPPCLAQDLQAHGAILWALRVRALSASSIGHGRVRPSRPRSCARLDGAI